MKPIAPSVPKELGGFAGFVEDVKPLLPVVIIPIVATILYYMFRTTWRALDEDAQRERAKLLAKGEMDRRPLVALISCGIILTLQEYYGGGKFFVLSVLPVMKAHDHGGSLGLAKYESLWGFGWWAGTRVLGYLAPFLVWKAFFRKDSLLDLGLRTRGFFDHVWIYLIFLSAVVPGLIIVSSAPDFASYYPFYEFAGRSWFEFFTWEAMYFAQFFALEMFFRGWWLGALRKSFGSGAIFAMAVPYCMIHYGKPYLEACGAILAGIALGSLSMRTKSIYQGFLIHITVAAMMDWRSLRHRHCTPLTLWPTDKPFPMDKTIACTVDVAQRDELAGKIEMVVIPLFFLAIVFVIVMALRANRRRSLAI